MCLYCLIQYEEDEEREEGRNVGVFRLDCETGIAVKTLEGVPDLQPFARRLGLLAHVTIETLRHFDACESGPFRLAPAHAILCMDPDYLLDALFRRLVLPKS